MSKPACLYDETTEIVEWDALVPVNLFNWTIMPGRRIADLKVEVAAAAG